MGTDSPRLPNNGSFAPRFPGLIELDLAHCPMDDSRLTALKGLENLAVLTLGPGVGFWAPSDYIGLSARLTSQGLAHLRDLPLSTLSLAGCRELPDRALAGLDRGTGIRFLDLRGCFKLTDAALPHLAGIPLTRLELGVSPKITDAGLQVSNSFQACTLRNTKMKSTSKTARSVDPRKDELLFILMSETM